MHYSCTHLSTVGVKELKSNYYTQATLTENEFYESVRRLDIQTVTVS